VLQEKQATAKALWLGTGGYPTHRKVRDEWGTLRLAVGGREQAKARTTAKAKCGGSSLRSE
jgi:hypothetical protein